MLHTYEDAVAAAIAYANERGLAGQRVRIAIVPPPTATASYMLAVDYLSPKAATES